MKLLRPTLFVSVPRVLHRMHDKIKSFVSEQQAQIIFAKELEFKKLSLLHG
jgi:long-subunit acyl-CoA synthetase (AMP-forming)